jgi:hypothetical protein
MTSVGLYLSKGFRTLGFDWNQTIHALPSLLVVSITPTKYVENLSVIIIINYMIRTYSGIG